MAKKRSSASAVSAAWRLLLIPFAFILWNLLPMFDVNTLEFARRVMDCWGNADFTLSFVFLGLSVVGLIGLIVTPARKMLPEAIWLILLLLPVWYRGELVSAAMGAKAIGKIDWNPLALLTGALCSLWALVPVRGEGRGWVRMVLAVLLISLNLYLLYADGDRVSRWFDWFTILSVAVIAGWAVDWVNGGICLQSFLPALVSAAAVLLTMTELTNETRLYIIAALSAVFAVILLIRSPAQKRSGGGIMVLIGFAICAMSPTIVELIKTLE